LKKIGKKKLGMIVYFVLFYEFFEMHLCDNEKENKSIHHKLKFKKKEKKKNIN